MWHWFYIYIHIKMYIFFLIFADDLWNWLSSTSPFCFMFSSFEKNTSWRFTARLCAAAKYMTVNEVQTACISLSKKMRLKYGRLRCTSLSSYRHANITLKSEWQLFLALVNLAVDIWHDNYVPFVLIMDFLLQLIRRRFWCFLNNIHWEILDSWSVR